MERLLSWLRWLWSGHRHASVGEVLVPLLVDGAPRARLVEAERCSCGAVRPREPFGSGWLRPPSDD